MCAHQGVQINLLKQTLAEAICRLNRIADLVNGPTSQERKRNAYLLSYSDDLQAVLDGEVEAIFELKEGE